MTTILIKNGSIQNPGKPQIQGDILVKDGKIAEIGNISAQNKDAAVIDAKGCLITPALIDQHLHGGYDCNFNTAGVDEILNFLENLPKHGIASICPTIMTDKPENIKAQIKKIVEAKRKTPDTSAKIVGINIEGPFINPEYRGAHSKELCLTPTIDSYKQFEHKEIKIITIAPELDKDLELTKYLADKGVIVSAGHTNASADRISVAKDAGLSQITHIFNGMPPLHHRQPGIVGKSLIEDSLYVEAIADNHHLHPDIINLILRTKPKDKVIFVSDSLPLAESSNKSTVFGGQMIFKSDEVAINEEGRFAGSLMMLDAVIRKNANAVNFADLLMYCAYNPAKNLGLKDCGVVKKGTSADIAVWDAKTLEIRATLINGNLCYTK
ncbi:MAG: N-acetylglucosamine-6-phosphate deacetylase [Candidatus Gastranaerophilales bacterium]|jgi:N-acetylglucosamine-6-phosphate deacetylase|nr:N-acetylglucosamine-6-phosphate deacetylase [Candidatus Gastranaerophilales bacterium]